MTIKFASSKNDTDILEAAMASRMMVKGYVRMYRRDGTQKLFDYEFANAFILLFNETFDATSKNPVTIKIIIAPGILKKEDWIFANYWNPNNPFITAAAPISSSDNEPQITSHYIEDLERNQIDKSEIDIGEEINLIVESNNAVGELFELNLDDSRLDYEHNGIKLENDILEVVINNYSMSIPLKAIKQEN